MKKISSITVLIMIVLLSKPTFSAEVNLKTRVGFNGYTVPGTLAPVLIEINRAITNGRLEIVSPSETASYSIIDSFSTTNLKRIEASVFVTEDINDLKIRLISNKHTLLETGLNLKAKIFPGNLILAVKIPSITQQMIEKALLPSEPTLVVPIEIPDLPGVALNYDGVGGLVLSDPGPVLKPLQIQALKTWLAGGGRMALGAIRSGQDSLLSILGISPELMERSFYPIGFGGITAFRSGFNDLKQSPSDWQEVLDLRPYPNNSRLMSSRFFPDFRYATTPGSAELSSRAVSYLAMILILWAVSGLLITVTVKHNRLFFLICAALLWLGAAFPIGNWLGGIWNRGAEIHCRNLVLPETGSILVDVKIWFKQSYSGKTINFKSSPWGGKVLIGEAEGGIVKPESQIKTFTWSRGPSKTETVVKSVGPGWVNLNGYLPLKSYLTKGMDRIGLARKLVESESEVVIWDGKDFYQRSFRQVGNGWEKKEQPPEWLRAETEWLTNLKRLSTGTVWLIGRGSLSEVKIGLEKGIFTGEIWAAPFPEGAME